METRIFLCYDLDMIRELLKSIVLESAKGLHGVETGGLDVTIDKTSHEKFGDYSTNIAFGLSKTLKISPQEIAVKIAEKINGPNHKEVERAEAVGGYVNFFLSKAFLREQLSIMAGQSDYGFNKKLGGQTVMVEFTDPNPFKLFHIGHLMSNAIGESIARLYEASGARVIRANYQGDVGLHVAKAIWAKKNNPTETLEQAYALGSKAYDDAGEDSSIRKEIEEINKQIYNRTDLETNKLYDKGRAESLEDFEKIYKKLGTKFDNYFFESEMGKLGLGIVAQHPEVFTKSQGAIIFEGEKYGLHTRVFVSSQGLPTYEAKELGLNKKKFELYSGLDLSVVVTGNEINDYFKVLMKVMSLVIPSVAEKTKHVGHGMLRLPTGKMSSRTGDVITAESFINEVKSKVLAKTSEESGKLDSLESNSDQIAIGAIKYSILKQSPGKDIIFDFDKSLSINGDSGPYLQYTYARLRSVLHKAGDIDIKNHGYKFLDHESELNLIKKLLDFPEAIQSASELLTPSHLALYLYELASLANNFYEKIRILNDDNPQRLMARLELVDVVSQVLKKGLGILGIQTLERI